MNLKPAELWADQANWSALIHKSIETVEITKERQTRYIRRIQADALRYAIAFVKERQLIRATLQELNHQANQLDPRPET